MPHRDAKKMTFGERSIFAIEAVADRNFISSGSAVWGSMCVWCDGKQLGNLRESGCSLSGVATHFKRTIPRLNTLWDREFEGLADREIFRLLHGLLFSGETLGAISPESAWDRFGALSFLTNWGEQFDGLQAFLVSRPSGELQVLYRFLDGPLSVASIRTEVFLGVTAQFLDWCEVEADSKEMSKDNT